jgi:FlaA1/EpsC-like NDP-sugar epimerase
MALERLLIIGAGGHGRSVAEAAMLCGQREVVGPIDDGVEVCSKIWDFPVLGTTADLQLYPPLFDKVIMAIGNNCLRHPESLTLG